MGNPYLAVENTHLTAQLIAQVFARFCIRCGSTTITASSAGMVGIVEESCKKALDATNPSEVEIDIDTLDLATFLKVERYVQDCLARQKKKSK